VVNPSPFEKSKTRSKKRQNGEYFQLYHRASMKDDGIFHYDALKPKTAYPCKSFTIIANNESKINNK